MAAPAGGGNDMRVVYKMPTCPAIVRDIPNTLEALQQAVGGKIEPLQMGTDDCILVNEEGKVRGLTYNMELCGETIMGPVLVVGVDGEEFCDLNRKDAAWWKAMLNSIWERERIRHSGM